MFAQLGCMYGWTPEYILDQLSIEEVFMYYDYGLVFEEIKAGLLVAKISQALDGKSGPLMGKNDKPDKRAFYNRYKKQIKRPGGEK